MKKVLIFLFALAAVQFSQAQRNKKKGNDFKSDLAKHYQAYYKQMLQYNDLDGAIGALNHVILLDPSSEARKDTLGFLYLQSNKPLQAVKVVDASTSEMALRTKALGYKALNVPKKAIENYEKLIGLNKSVMDAYELAQLQFSIQRFGEAKSTIAFGLQNAKDEKVRIFVKGNNYLETPIKAAFFNILGLIEYNLDKSNIDGALAIFDEALKIDPKFVLAIENKKGLLAQKNKPKQPQKK